MTIQFFQSTAEPIRVDKSEYITEVASYEATLRGETSVVNPVLLVQSTELIKGNYVYIKEFERYYYVEDVVSVRMDLWRVTLKCDVLMSFKDEIYKCKAFLIRNETKYDNNLVDKILPLKSVPEVEIVNDNFDEYNNKLFVPGYGIGTVVITCINDLLPLGIDANEIIDYWFSPYKETCTTYVLQSANAIKTVLSTIMADPAIASNILSIYIFPNGRGIEELMFQKRSSRSSPDQPYIYDGSVAREVTYKDVKIGTTSVPAYTDTQWLDTFNLPYKTLQLYSADFGWYFEFKIKRKYKNYLDYEPYTVYEIYIPLYGWYKLDSYKIFDTDISEATITIRVTLDVTDGSATAFVYNGTAGSYRDEFITDGKGAVINKPIDTFSYQYGQELPITNTGVGEIQRRSQVYMLQGINNAITSIGSIAGGVVANSPMSVAGGITGLSSTILSWASNEAVNIPIGSTSRVKSYYGSAMSTYSSAFVRITHNVPALNILNEDDFKKYHSLLGGPCSISLENIEEYKGSGLSLFGECHLENMPRAYKGDIDEIDRYLKSLGVIL